MKAFLVLWLRKITMVALFSLPVFENLIIHDCFIEDVSEGMYLEKLNLLEWSLSM
jgi:hypothetical protein